MTTTTDTSTLVRLDRREGVLTITVNRPAQKNAVNHEVAVQLAAAVDQLDADPQLSVGVLTGTGGTFSAAWTSRHSRRASCRWSAAGGSAGSPARWYASH